MIQHKIDLMLKSVLSRKNVTLDSQQRNAVKEFAIEYALHTVDAYRANENKAVTIEAVRFFPSLFRGEMKLWLRKILFLRAKKEAISRASVENRKIYVIRTTDIAYITLSTQQVSMAKDMKLFGKYVDAVKLHEKSDFVAYPKR